MPERPAVEATEAPLSTEVGGRNALAALSPRRRRLIVLGALARTGASVAVLVSVYFLLPLDRLDSATSALLLGGGLVLVGVVLGVQVRATIRAVHPTLRAIESLGVSVPLLLLLFSAAHYLIAASVPGSYTQELGRLDALYFSVTMFATVGFGDIAPVTSLTRTITVMQMLINVIFLGVVARVLFGAALDGRRAATVDQ